MSMAICPHHRRLQCLWGFSLFKGLHLGAFSLVAAPLLKKPWAIPGVSAAWVAVEGTHQYLGFTWLHLGNAGVNMSVLSRLAPYTGVYGISFAIAVMNVAVAIVVLRRPRVELAWLGFLPLLYLLPSLPEAQLGSEAARLLQTNVRPDEIISGRWTRARATAHLQRMEFLLTEEADLIAPTPPSLVIWPEYPVPAYFFDDRAFSVIHGKSGPKNEGSSCVQYRRFSRG